MRNDTGPLRDDGLQEARRRIESSRGEPVDLAQLDLTDGDLAHLIGLLTALPGLTSLDLWGNRLTALPDAFADLPALATLDLGGNLLERFPEPVTALPALSVLTLSGNVLASLPDTVGDLAALTALNLRGNHLGEVPASLGRLAGLVTLTLSTNRLTSLPDTLAGLTALTSLNLPGNLLTVLPDSIGALSELTSLDLRGNRLTELPASIGRLRRLVTLDVWGNRLRSLPESLGDLADLTTLLVGRNALEGLPESLGRMRRLRTLNLRDNRVASLPRSLGGLPELREIDVSRNPLPEEVCAAATDGTQELVRFLHLVHTEGQYLCEAKLLLVGEGMVGKTTLLAALRGEPPLHDPDTTQGIEIKPVTVTHDGQTITLNGWDFGGQQIYRATHQLFFSRPAVYLVVWKPRAGPEAGMVEDWIRMIRNRAGTDVRVHVVATHGGPAQRFAHLDEVRLKQQFGSMIAGFHHVDSPTGRGIGPLLAAIGATALGLQHITRWYPGSWLRLKDTLSARGEAYLPYAEYQRIARAQGLSDSSARSLAINAHALGHWVHYADDPGMRDLVVLKPDWLSRAIGFVLDDPEAVGSGGLVTDRHLAQVWDSPDRAPEHRYDEHLQLLFRGLMEQFGLSYRVPDSRTREPTSLVAQLVPAAEPDLTEVWTRFRSAAEELAQTCRITETGTNRDIVPEALLYRLLVLFHRYSLGRDDVRRSVHWQLGFLLADRYGSRALLRLERSGLTVRVRGPYPQRFLHHLTAQIQEYVEDFWKGLSARFAVPCGADCGIGVPGTGLFDIQKVIAQREKHRSHFLCPVPECDHDAEIAGLLEGIGVQASTEAERLVTAVREAMRSGFDAGWHQILGRLDDLDDADKIRYAQIEARLEVLQRGLDDEAADGPRLFTLEQLDASLRHPTSIQLRLTLWCEHSRVPVSILAGNPKAGVYDLTMARDWWIRAAPLIRATSIVLKALLPVSLSVAELELSDAQWDAVKEQLAVGRDLTSIPLDRGADVTIAADAPPGRGTHGPATPLYAEGGLLRSLHETLRQKDPTFADLRRVRTVQGRYAWVHRRYEFLYTTQWTDSPAP